MRNARIVSARREPAVPPHPATAGQAWVRAALVWGCIGFIAGAVFWNCMGFWSFLSEVVLDRTPSAHAADMPIAKTPGAEPPVVVIDTNRCTMLTLDRRSNLTLSRPCPPSRLAMQVGRETILREDLAVLDRPHLQAARYRAD